MPLECSELFAMAPIAWRLHSTEYKIPKSHNMGSGMVAGLQKKLVSKFERLTSQTNSFLEAEARSVHFDLEALKGSMDASKKCIKVTRDSIVELMATIYSLGHEPLPPNEDVDKDVARIINDCCLTSAAQAATKTVSSKAESTFAARGDGKSGVSVDAVAAKESKATIGREAKNSAIIKLTVRTNSAIRGDGKSGVWSNVVATEDSKAGIEREVKPAARTRLTVRTNSAMRGDGKSGVWSNAVATEDSKAGIEREVKPAARTRLTVRTNSAMRGDGKSGVWSNAVATEDSKAGIEREVKPAARTRLTIRTNSAMRGDVKSAVRSNAVAAESESTFGRQAMAAVRSKLTERAKSVVSEAKFAVRRKAQVRAAAAPRPRLMSRGAAARARAEAAWDARAMAEAIDRERAAVASSRTYQ